MSSANPAVIQVSHLGKLYRLRHQNRSGTGLRHVLHDALHSSWDLLRGRKTSKSGPDSSEEFWALDDVSFEIGPGEAVGIIGRNGAGKSTLLKILSRITEPTRGRVEIGGRVASLLEVGTGFHHELTGRENIFLNGTILGMNRREINAKFDEIVAFAEVNRFLDTPVKYYSSGMYVRLAFAVAAHLEPEVLVVDEVLAVGDAQFQSKCLGKMDEVSRKEGRTVLFVSHNMAAIQQLTKRCIVLGQGKILFDGKTERAVQVYHEALGADTALFYDVEHARRQHIGTLAARIVSLRLDRESPVFAFAEEFHFLVKLEAREDISSFNIHLTISNAEGAPVGSCFSADLPGLKTGERVETGVFLDGIQLAPGYYFCGVALTKGDNRTGFIALDIVSDTLRFEVLPEPGKEGTVAFWTRGWGSLVFPKLKVLRQDRSSPHEKSA